MGSSTERVLLPTAGFPAVTRGALSDVGQGAVTVQAGPLGSSTYMSAEPAGSRSSGSTPSTPASGDTTDAAAAPADGPPATPATPGVPGTTPSGTGRRAGGEPPTAPITGNVISQQVHHADANPTGRRLATLTLAALGV